MTKKAAAILVVLCTLMTLCACLNPVSIDTCGYVVAIGVDEGAEEKFLVTLELQRESSGTDQENNGGAVILSCEANNLPQAVSELSSSIAYDLNFTRTHIFVFGINIARKGQIDEFFEIAFDVFRIRESALMLIADEKAVDYIAGLASDDAANIAKLQDHLISNIYKTGKLSAINVATYYEAVRSGRFDPVLPLGRYDENIITDKKQNDNASKGENPLKDASDSVRVGGMQSITEGSAFFNGSIMTGTLSPYETQLMNIVKGDFKQGIVQLDLANGETVSVFLMLNKRCVNISISGSSPAAEVLLVLNVTIESDPSGTLGKRWNDEGRWALEAYLASEMQRVFLICRGAGSDAMGFGRYASMKFASTEEWESYNWKKQYGNLSTKFKVELILDDRYVIDHGR